MIASVKAVATQAQKSHLVCGERFTMAVDASSNSLSDCMKCILVQGTLEEKTNAASKLQKIAEDRKQLQALKATDGLEDGLTELLKQRVSERATKAAITTIYYAARDTTLRVRLVKAGVVPLLLEILLEADKPLCERTLAALDILCSCVEGRSAAYGHALTVPLVVKKILRVSNVASDFAVSLLWTICRYSSDGCAMLEALQSGAFQKILLLIQLGCSNKTRKKSTQLLKLFSHYRDEWECIDTVDFQDVKRSF